MNTKIFNDIITNQLEYCKSLLVKKGNEYVIGTEDRLRNFKTAAALQSITSKQALCGMLAKHLVSINDMCREGDYSNVQWREKITDSINYLLILGAIIQDENNLACNQGLSELRDKQTGTYTK